MRPVGALRCRPVLIVLKRQRDIDNPFQGVPVPVKFAIVKLRLRVEQEKQVSPP